MGITLGRVAGRDVIVSGAYDRTIRVWDAASTRSSANPLLGHSDRVRSVVLGRLNDRDVVVSGGDDGTVRLWNAANSDLLRQLEFGD